MISERRRLGDDLDQPPDVRLEISRDVATITIDRPEDDNRLTPSTLAGLREIASRLAADARTSCVVITGAGSAFFSSGIFNIRLRTAYSKEDALGIVALANEAFDAIEALPQLTIAALNGAVRAGGGELALACDVRIAASHATLAFHETSYACFPGAGAPARLAAIVGAGRALEIIATGREVDAEEMLRLGLTSRILPQPAWAPEIQALAARIAAKGPLGIRGAKQIAQARLKDGADAARDLSWSLRQELEYSQDVDEAIAAHVEGRPARYLGR